MGFNNVILIVLCDTCDGGQDHIDLCNMSD